MAVPSLGSPSHVDSVSVVSRRGQEGANRSLLLNESTNVQEPPSTFPPNASSVFSPSLLPSSSPFSPPQGGAISLASTTAASSSGQSSSRVIVLLTTSEGRDKLFKCVQYAMKLMIWLLQQRGVFPESLVDQQRQLALRLCGNVQTVRNGRALFKLGWWIPTIFDLSELWHLLRPSPLIMTTPAESDYVAPEALRAGDDSTIASVAGDGVFDSAAQNTATELGGTAEALVSSATLVQPRRQPTFNRRRLFVICVLIIRCIASIVRNVCRDVAFVEKKNLFGLGDLASLAQQSRLLRVATLCWVVLSSCDVVLCGLRLANRAWIPAIERFKCYCVEGAHDFQRIAFSALDLQRGAPTTVTAHFLNATDPGSFQLTCRRCGATRFARHRGVNTSTAALRGVSPDSVLAVLPPRQAPSSPPPPPPLTLPQGPAPVEGWPPSSDGTAVVEGRSRSMELLAAASGNDDATDGRSVLYIPKLLRRLYRVTFVLTHHANLYHSLALFARYLGDAYMAMSYAGVGFRAGAGGFSMSASSSPLAIDEVLTSGGRGSANGAHQEGDGVFEQSAATMYLRCTAEEAVQLRQHERFALNACGLFSSAVALSRVWIAAAGS